ncbi:Protein translation factor SUI1 like protein [Astathelohania contejeani]|uniref:Protein translation factor SUI1 like protein n=1 Tax=Astathelohania contejeani TaxID=164912 RepID=A0ABQ7HX61_9MICR|nr:Protein translation factor SUI1 like protein [Thelohania contejeani]
MEDEFEFKETSLEGNFGIDAIKKSEQMVHVRIQQLYGRKKLTIIEGVPSKTLPNLFSDLKKSLSCGGKLDKKAGVIQLQGDYSLTIAKELEPYVDGYRVVVHGKRS